jgi:hypothetical protein
MVLYYYALHAALRMDFLKTNFILPGVRACVEPQKSTIMAEWNPWYLNMDNSPAYSHYSEQSQSQHLYHVSSESTIHHQEQEDTTSEDEDEERESSIEGDTHENHLIEALPATAILPPQG